MLSDILIGIAVIVALLGGGSALAALLRMQPGCGERGLLGLVGVASVGSVLHLVIPISSYVQLVVMIVGILLAVVFRQQLQHSVSWVSVLSLIGGAVTAAAISKGLPLPYDDGLYYLQTIRWLREFPIVLGLANLHGRLAFNSQDFVLLAALPPAGPWVVRSVLCGFLVSAFVGEVDRARQADSFRPVVFWYATLAAIALLSKIVVMIGEGPLDPDFLAAGLVMYWGLIALRIFPGSRENATDYGLFAVLGIFVAMVKLSYLPVLAATLLGGWFWRSSGSKSRLRISAFVAVTFTVWLARGILLTGCVLYPAPQSCMYFLPWAVTPEQVTWYVLAVKSWARDTGNFDYHAVVSNWHWLRPWLNKMLHHRLILIALGGVAAGLLSGVRAIRSPSIFKRGYVLMGFFVTSLVWWFLTAPDPRFGAGILLALGLVGFSLFLTAVMSTSRPWMLRYAGPAVSSLVILAGTRAVLKAGPPFLDETPVTKAYEFRDPTIPRIWVPQYGERCWDHPLPCTPYVHPETWRRVRWPKSLPVFRESSFVTPPGWPECKSEDSRRHPAAFWPRDAKR